MPEFSLDYANIIARLAFSCLALVLTLVANRVLRNVLRVRVKDPTHVHTLYMLARNSIFLAGSILILLIWLGVGSNLTVAMGILGAGIAFASQEVIGSFAGYVNIVTGNLFRIGDRVRVGNVVGDVLDVGVLRTTVMEIGEWVRADQYTGRIVTLANRVVFAEPVFNYTQRWKYLWDEIMIPITYNSDWRHAEEVMLEYGREYTEQFKAEAQAGFQSLMERYPVSETTVDPALYVMMTDNWIELTLRYVVDARKRREVKGQLHYELLKHFAAESNITVASATFEIVGFPPLNGEVGVTRGQRA